MTYKKLDCKDCVHLTKELLQKYRDSDDFTRRSLEEHIFQLNKSLIYRTLQMFRVPADKYEDFFQEASKGLLDAIRRFNIDAKVAFSTFAVNTMKGVIKNGYRDKTWLLKVSRTDKEKGGRVAALGEDSDYGHEWSAEETQRLRSLINAQHPADLTAELISNKPDSTKTIEQKLCDVTSIVALDLISQLPEDLKTVIQLAYIDDYSPEEISVALILDLKDVQQLLSQGVGFCKSLTHNMAPEVFLDVYEGL